MKDPRIYPRILSEKASPRAKATVALLFIAAAAALLYGGSRMSEVSTLRYQNARIAGIVRQVIGFNRGFPILSISGQRTYISHLPPDFGKYILPGDSVYKASGEFTVTSYRKTESCTEVITWKYGILNGYEQPDIRREKRCRY